MGVLVLLFYILIDFIRRLTALGFSIDLLNRACDKSPLSSVCESSIRLMYIFSTTGVAISIVLMIWNMFVIRQASDVRTYLVAQRQPVIVSYSNAAATLTAQ
jgi:hypothetical protein